MGSAGSIPSFSVCVSVQSTTLRESQLVQKSYSQVMHTGFFHRALVRCRGCGPCECASVVSTRGRPGLAELGRARKEGKCRGVGESRKLEAQLKNGALSATKRV